MTNLYGALTKDNGTISLIINNAKSLSKKYWLKSSLVQGIIHENKNKKC